MSTPASTPDGELITVATCHTPGCANADQPAELTVTWQDDDGSYRLVDSVWCGTCSTPLTDLDPDYWSNTQPNEGHSNDQ